VVDNVTERRPEPARPEAESTNASVLGDYARHPLLQDFEFEHLPGSLREVSVRFAQLADFVVSLPWARGHRDVALRKLLEAKDCACRAALPPKGT